MYSELDMPMSNQFTVADSPYPRGRQASEDTVARLESLRQGYCRMFLVTLAMGLLLFLTDNDPGHDSPSDFEIYKGWYLLAVFFALYLFAFWKCLPRREAVIGWSFLEAVIVAGWYWATNGSPLALPWIYGWIALVCIAGQATAVSHIRDFGLKGRLPLYSRLRFRALVVGVFEGAQGSDSDLSATVILSIDERSHAQMDR